MLAEERFAMILDLLAQKRSATVLELCDALDASESTIRRDLTQLDRQGLLKKGTRRCHAGWAHTVFGG